MLCYARRHTGSGIRDPAYGIMGAAKAAGHLAFDRHHNRYHPWRLGLLGALLIVAACTLAACGRAGAPELPPGPALAPAAQASPPPVPLSASPQIGPPPVGSAPA